MTTVENRGNSRKYAMNGQNVSTAQHVYKDLRHRIINCHLPPGANISQNEIAVQFGVSATPVRDAFLRLAGEGLINIYPQSRTVVSLIDEQNARDVEFLRVSVELEVLRVLAKTITRDGVKELTNWIRRQVVEMEIGNEWAFKFADDNFHNCMFKLAGVEGLIDIISAQRGHYDRIRGLYFPAFADLGKIIDEHRNILTALENHDAQGAKSASREHIRRSLMSIDQLREEHGDYFL